MSKKSQAIRSLLSAFGEVLNLPSPEKRRELDGMINAVVGGLDDGDVDYLQARLDALAEDIRTREDQLTPRQRLLEDMEGMWKR